MMFGDEKEREKTRQVKLDRLFVAGGYIVSIRPLLAPLTLTVQNKGARECIFTQTSTALEAEDMVDKFNYCAYMLYLSFKLGAKTDFNVKE